MWHILGLLLVISFVAVFSRDGVMPKQIQSQQRQLQQDPQFLYQQAKQALERRDWQHFNRLANGLVNYSLYQDLYYHALREQLPQLPLTQIDHFFATYPKSLLAKQLRHALLKELARQQQWALYAKYYRKASANLAERCHYIMATYHLGNKQLINTYDKSLWLRPYSTPKACDPLLSYWLAHQVIPPAQLWARFKLALQHKNLSLARYVQKQLPPVKSDEAKQWIKVYKKPQRVKALLKPMKSPHLDLVEYGLLRWAKRQPAAAATWWPKFVAKFHFSEAQKTEIIQRISHGLIRKNQKLAQRWLKTIDFKYYDKVMLFWRIRAPLSQQHWAQVKTIIDQLDFKQQQQPIWRYWYARALEHLGQEQQATMLYQQLAQERHYYALLAADQLDVPFKPIMVKPALSILEKLSVAQHPGIQKSKAYYAMNDYHKGNQTWWFTMDKLSDRQRYIAARLAQEWGWHLVALKTTVKTRYKADLDLRFPRLYHDHVSNMSERHDLEPALVYAIIRQESLFYPAAKSSAGAMGLMQLMPYTAKMIINEGNMPTDYKKRLHEPHVNIQLGCYYLSHLFQNYYTHPVLTIASYNAGPNRIKQWLPKEKMSTDLWVELIPFHETRNYVKNVITYIAIYQHLMGAQPNLNAYLEQGIKP